MEKSEILNKARALYRQIFLRGFLITFAAIFIAFVAMIIFLPGVKPKSIWDFRYALMASIIMAFIIGHIAALKARRFIRLIKQGEKVDVIRARLKRIVNDNTMHGPEAITGTIAYYYFERENGLTLTLDNPDTIGSIKEGDMATIYLFRNKYAVREKGTLMYTDSWIEK